MFNMSGEVIGIVCHMVSRTGRWEGLGFAVSSNAVRELLLERRSPWIGFTSRPLSADLARALNVRGPNFGVLVQRVAQGSPAHLMGLRGGTVRATIGGKDMVLGGDIVLKIQGLSLGLAEPEQISEVLRRTQPGDELRVTVFRAGESLELKTKLAH